MPTLPVPLCEPCLRRNRQSRGERKVNGEWFCSLCFFGKGGEERHCRVCARTLRESNGSEYCSHCSQSGAAKRDMKRKEESDSREFVVPPNLA